MERRFVPMVDVEGSSCMGETQTPGILCLTRGETKMINAKANTG